VGKVSWGGTRVSTAIIAGKWTTLPISLQIPSSSSPLPPPRRSEVDNAADGPLTMINQVCVGRMLGAMFGGFVPVAQSCVADLCPVDARPKFLGRVQVRHTRIIYRQATFHGTIAVRHTGSPVGRPIPSVLTVRLTGLRALGSHPSRHHSCAPHGNSPRCTPPVAR
jgi:hypothetical protein